MFHELSMRFKSISHHSELTKPLGAERIHYSDPTITEEFSPLDHEYLSAVKYSRFLDEFYNQDVYLLTRIKDIDVPLYDGYITDKNNHILYNISLKTKFEFKIGTQAYMNEMVFKKILEIASKDNQFQSLKQWYRAAMNGGFKGDRFYGPSHTFKEGIEWIAHTLKVYGHKIKDIYQKHGDHIEKERLTIIVYDLSDTNFEFDFNARFRERIDHKFFQESGLDSIILIEKTRYVELKLKDNQVIQNIY
ncbi:MAG: hypothetical protein H6622_17745 [Halobacteriovoraceae bacterium]|nr:hypothetical protein [Halobacteriovoraceae bacterium]